MLTSVKAGPYTVRGISVGGIYTALHVPELNVGLDVGLAPRSIAGVKRLFISHGHVDHVGALATMLGIRALFGMSRPLEIYAPEEITHDLATILDGYGKMQRLPPPPGSRASPRGERNSLAFNLTPLAPGEEQPLDGDLWVRSFRTDHPVPSLGYQFFRKVQKLRADFSHLAGAEIAARRQAGEEIFDPVERLELAYATDTLTSVFEREPSLLASKVLILECTFLDQRKSLAASHAGHHTHLDDLLELAGAIENQHLVLMHFSQIYKPTEISEILDRRCPPELRARMIPFAPAAPEWPG